MGVVLWRHESTGACVGPYQTIGNKVCQGPPEMHQQQEAQIHQHRRQEREERSRQRKRLRTKELAISSHLIFVKLNYKSPRTPQAPK